MIPHGLPVLIGGDFHGRYHPAILTRPLPPSFMIAPQAGGGEAQIYLQRLGMLGRERPVSYYAFEDLSEEDSWELVMDIVINKVGFEELK